MGEHVEVELIAERTSIQPGVAITVGLRMSLDRDWHTYWKNPGDAGMEPAIEWRLPPGFRAGPIQWPAPQRIAVGPLVNFGYSDGVLFPVRITVPERIAADRVTLQAKVDWLVCADVCINGCATVELELAVAAAAPEADERWAELFATTRARLPRPPRTEVSAVLRNGRPTLLVAARGDAVFFPENDGVIEYVLCLRYI